jgi:hypothetical protein
LTLGILISHVLRATAVTPARLGPLHLGKEPERFGLVPGSSRPPAPVLANLWGEGRDSQLKKATAARRCERK